MGDVGREQDVFVAHELGLELVRALGRVLPRIARRDKDLARQLRRSAASVVLNLAEGMHSDAGNRQARYANAAGSAKETQSALIIAEAWGYVRSPELLELADRLAAITYRLAHGPIPRHAPAQSASPRRLPAPEPDSAPPTRPSGPGQTDSEPDSGSEPAPDSDPTG